MTGLSLPKKMKAKGCTVKFLDIRPNTGWKVHYQNKNFLETPFMNLNFDLSQY